MDCETERKVGTGTEGTNSNVEWQLQSFHTGGHETNGSGQREDESRGFPVAEESLREKVARCCDDELRDRLGTGKDCGEIRAGPNQEKQVLNDYLPEED